MKAISHALVLAACIPCVVSWSHRISTQLRHRKNPTLFSTLPGMALSDSGEELLSQLFRFDSEEALAEVVVQKFDDIGQPEILALRSRANGGSGEPARWGAVLGAVNTEMQNRIERARAKIEELLEAGEVRELDAQMIRAVKDGFVDPAFIMVLNKNIEAAMEISTGGDDVRLNMLNHIATRIQEEVEKRAEPSIGILHKLMRTEDPQLRERIMTHYLTPQTEIVTPTAQRIPLKTPKAALVDPIDFARAVETTVGQLRSLDADGDAIVANIDGVRQLAKEARVLIASTYPADVLDEYSTYLMSTFRFDVNQR